MKEEGAKRKRQDTESKAKHTSLVHCLPESTSAPEASVGENGGGGGSGGRNR